MKNIFNRLSMYLHAPEVPGRHCLYVYLGIHGLRGPCDRLLRHRAGPGEDIRGEARVQGGGQPGAAGPGGGQPLRQLLPLPPHVRLPLQIRSPGGQRLQVRYFIK